METRGALFFIRGWAECVISRQSVCAEASDDPGGGAAPRGWASSIGEGGEASRWESVSVSGDAPGLICLRPSGLGSMEQRSLQPGESLCAAAAH